MGPADKEKTLHKLNTLQMSVAEDIQYLEPLLLIQSIYDQTL